MVRGILLIAVGIISATSGVEGVISCENTKKLSRLEISTACIIFSEAQLELPNATYFTPPPSFSPDISSNTGGGVIFDTPSPYYNSDYYKRNNQSFVAVFRPTVDKFGLWDEVVNATTLGLIPDRMRIHVRVGNHTTSWGRTMFQYTEGCRALDGSCPGFVAVYHAAVVLVDKGLVTGVEWDPQLNATGCFPCPEHGCIEGRCGVALTECGDLGMAADACRMKIYLAWKGTDVKGLSMTSNSLLISNFERFGVSKAVDAALTLGSGVLQEAGSSLSIYEEPQDPGRIYETDAPTGPPPTPAPSTPKPTPKP